MSEANGRRGPYQGLVPYSEDDAEWFFGRDEWREVIADNLRAYRITVVYGESGVGKSSLLRAGVVRTLRDEARLQAFAFAAWSLDDPIAALKVELAGAAGDSLADVCDTAAGRGEGPLLLVLDQLEELFVYHQSGSEGRSANLRRHCADVTHPFTFCSRSVRTRSLVSTASRATCRALATTSCGWSRLIAGRA